MSQILTVTPLECDEMQNHWGSLQFSGPCCSTTSPLRPHPSAQVSSSTLTCMMGGFQGAKPPWLR
ncbi:hypothetical protein SK128_020246, partial [Halocaridina rubra]